MDSVTSVPRLLILSFSPIAGDARVLKQVRHFSKHYDVVTCGYGESPAESAEHIRIPDTARQNDLDGRLITLHQYRLAYWRLGAVRWCRANLPRGDWDAIIANDVETVPLALSLAATKGVHADLHEFSPRLHSNLAAWKRRIQPYYEWLCRTYVAKASSWTTVSGGLARQYQLDFGFLPELAINAAPYTELSAGAVTSPIRLVHSGVCLRARNLIALVDAVEASTTPLTLDFYLTANDPAHLAELRARAAEVPGVTVHDPVPYEHLLETINRFDVGVFALPPATFNSEWALPNKLFDFVQARLGVVIGPSKEMVRYVEEYSLGLVTDGFDAPSIAAVLDTLTPENVAAMKASSDAAAGVLSAESQVAVWDVAVAAIVAGEQRSR